MNWHNEPTTNWYGEPTTDKVAVLANFGYGDFIQYARFLPAVKLRCPNLQVLFKDDSLLRLTRSSFKDVASSIYCGEIPKKWCSIVSLGLPMGIQTEGANAFTIPNKVPYLKTVDKAWKKASIGICWKTDNLQSPRYSQKCLPPDLARQLLNIPNSISLQREDLNVKDFSETAAIINTLDLVISIDTSIAHLAGALGKPTWLLLPYEFDERWLSPWYPTMRIFRQKTLGDWSEVIERVINKDYE